MVEYDERYSFNGIGMTPHEILGGLFFDWRFTLSHKAV